MSQQVETSLKSGMSVDLASASLPGTTVIMTNAVRAAIKRLWGRGPEFVRVSFAGENTILVLLGGILTESERTLLAVERGSAVISQRAALHRALEPEIRVILETNLGRDTEAFMSGIDVERDMASLVITLRRLGSSPPPASVTTPDGVPQPEPV